MSEGVRRARRILDEDGETVGEVWRIGRTLSSSYFLSVVMVYDIDTDKYDKVKHLNRHDTIEEAADNVRTYWGMA